MTPPLSTNTNTQASAPVAVAPRRRRLWLWRGCIGVIVLWLVFACGLGFFILQYGEQDRAQSSDVVIVLGAEVLPNGQPSSALRWRAEQAADVWQRGLASYIICTGGYSIRAPNHAQADACADVLLANGVPESAIRRERASKSTQENARDSLTIMQAEGWQTAIIVSDGFHLFRAQWIFADAGLPVTTSPVTNARWNTRALLWYTAREVAALHWHVVRQLFNIPMTDIPFF
jgi:uncharacterized SAM-binding protein YcdF (DUF218 family)